MPDHPGTELADALAVVEQSLVRAHLVLELLAKSEVEAVDMKRISSNLRQTGATVRDAAAILGITEGHVRRLLSSKDLFGVPFGGRIGWRIPRDHLHEFAVRWHGGGTPARRPRRP